VLFALDRIDELLALDEDDVFDYDCVADAIDALIDCRDEIELQRLPVYGRYLFGGLDRVPVESIREDTATELAKKFPPRKESRSRSEVNSRWKAKREDTLRRWSEHFSEAQ